jgi:chemotaxis-related protein WspD
MNMPLSDIAPTETATADAVAAYHDCWNQIGVMGDRSCAELETAIHCYDCPIYAAVGEGLLERQPPQGYIQEWINILSETPSEHEDAFQHSKVVLAEEAISVMIFRMGGQKLAMPVRVLKEVTHPYTIRPVPHRSNDFFLGLVNIRGEILPCASISHLLNLESEPAVTSHATERTKRMIVAGQQDSKWVFPVDEVYGSYRFHLSELYDAPVVITKAAAAYTQGVIQWEGKKVNYLDSELLFYSLNHKIL